MSVVLSVDGPRRKAVSRKGDLDRERSIVGNPRYYHLELLVLLGELVILASLM